jgi:hypothetical protein
MFQCILSHKVQHELSAFQFNYYTNLIKKPIF